MSQRRATADNRARPPIDDRPAARRRIRRFVLGLLLAPTLAACDGPDDVHFMMEFDAVVEGEAFAFETKLTCRPKATSSGTLFRKVTFYVLDRISFGMKLKSGKGAFVAAPDICEWYFDRVRNDDEMTLVWKGNPEGQEILPMIYVTDNYENPIRLRFFADPNGPDPATGVELRKCVVRPLTRDEATNAPERPRDEHDPFRTTTESSWVGHVFLRFADEVVPEVDPGELLLETARYRLYRQEEAKWEHTPLHYAEKYWMLVRRSVPLNDSIRSHYIQMERANEKKKKEYLSWKAEMARKGFADSISTVLDDETFDIDLGTRGVIDVYEWNFYRAKILENNKLRLALEGQTTEFSPYPQFFEGFVLQDLSTGQLYQMVRLSFRVAS